LNENLLTEETANKLIEALEKHTDAMNEFISVMERHVDALEQNASTFDDLSENIKGLATELYYSGINSLADEIKQIRETTSNQKKQK
jgi:methyl-accepting chemotaxis protein